MYVHVNIGQQFSPIARLGPGATLDRCLLNAFYCKSHMIVKNQLKMKNSLDLRIKADSACTD